MVTEIFSVNLESNLEDISKCFNNDSIWKWRDKLEELIEINKVNNVIKIDNYTFILNLEVYHNCLSLSLNTTSNDDPYITVLKDKNNQQKIIDFANNLINEYNQIFKDSSITNIPNAYLIYHGDNKFYVEINMGQKSIDFDYIILKITSDLTIDDFFFNNFS